jgi:hypothetical protein
MSNGPHWTGEQFEAACAKAAELAFNALTTDGAHHKQWYLEQIVRALGLDPEHFEKTTGITYERGIAP